MSMRNEFARKASIAVSAAIGILLLSCHLVFAQAGTWTTKAPMPTPRSFLSAGVVDGILYAVGGFKSDSYATVEAYDPKTNMWTTKAPMPGPRAFSAAAVVDGVLYVIGGGNLACCPYQSTVQAYDPKTDTWTTKAPMSTVRVRLAAAALDGMLYAIGGCSRDRCSSTMEAYDPKSDTWTARAPAPTQPSEAAAAVMGGLIYVVGGGYSSSVAAYDPKTNTWSTKAPMPTPRSGLAAVVVNGILYAVGGANNPTNNNPSGTPLATVEAYDPNTNTWTPKAPMPTPREGLAGGEVDETLYAVGGDNLYIPNYYLAVNEAFTPFLPVSIDIKPGDANNAINLKSAGTILVAILSSASFGATTVDPATVTLAGAPVATQGRGIPMTSVADLNRDGRLDLLLHFRTQDLQLTPTSTEAVLKGTTFSGQRIRGADSIRIVP